MAKYMVTGAVMQVPGATEAGDPAWVYAYRGAVLDLEPGSDVVKHHLDLNMIEKLADVENDPTVAAGGGPLSVAPVTPLHPALDADKPEWVAHAVRSGLREEDAEQYSAEELAAIFSGRGLEVPVDDQLVYEVPDEVPDAAVAVRPARTAKKESWVDFRVGQLGEEHREALDGMTKEELQDDGHVAALTAPLD